MIVKIFKRFSSNINIKNNVKTLGRWSTDKNLSEINLQTDWANHDHCGGDLCKFPNEKEKTKKKEIPDNEESKNNKD